VTGARTLRLSLDVNGRTLELLVRAAFREGWLREEPRRRWTERERKEAARWYLNRVLQTRIEELTLGRDRLESGE
jgi:hypothetical protein